MIDRLIGRLIDLNEWTGKAKREEGEGGQPRGMRWEKRSGWEAGEAKGNPNPRGVEGGGKANLYPSTPGLPG